MTTNIFLDFSAPCYCALLRDISKLGNSMSTANAELLALLAYRMKAISIGLLALGHHMTWDEAPSMLVFFNGMQVIEGKATGFTNAAIESAIIHCRAILEFLGLQGKSIHHRDSWRSARNKVDDWGVEKIPGLPILTKAKALSRFFLNKCSEPTHW